MHDKLRINKRVDNNALNTVFAIEQKIENFLESN